MTWMPYCAAGEDFVVWAAGPASPLRPAAFLVVFNAPVAVAGAQNATNYLLNGRSVFATATRVDSNPNVVALTLKANEFPTVGTSYYIKVNNVVAQDGRTLADTGHNGNTFRYETQLSAATSIVQCQLPDGAIAMGHDTASWVTGQPIWIVPYFAQIGLIGLLDYYLTHRDPVYLETTRKFLTWYASQMRADGTVTDYTGSYPTYTTTNNYDSSDSYAAFHLNLLWRYYEVSGDRAFVATLYPSVGKAVGAMKLTLQSDWLTWAKPDYLVKYTMDNIEVHNGFASAARLATLMNDTANANEWQATSGKVLQAVNSQLYLGDAKGYYSVGKFANGSLADTWDVYYPDGMAQCFALNVALEPTQARAVRVWNNTLAKFMPDGVPDRDMDFQFAWAALRMGQPTLSEIGYLLMLRNSSHYVQDSGLILQYARLTRVDSAVPAGAWSLYD